MHVEWRISTHDLQLNTKTSTSTSLFATHFGGKIRLKLFHSIYSYYTAGKLKNIASWAKKITDRMGVLGLPISGRILWLAFLNPSQTSTWVLSWCVTNRQAGGHCGLIQSFKHVWLMITVNNGSTDKLQDIEPPRHNSFIAWFNTQTYFEFHYFATVSFFPSWTLNLTRSHYLLSSGSSPTLNLGVMK